MIYENNLIKETNSEVNRLISKYKGKRGNGRPGCSDITRNALFLHLEDMEVPSSGNNRRFQLLH